MRTVTVYISLHIIWTKKTFPVCFKGGGRLKVFFSIPSRISTKVVDPGKRGFNTINLKSIYCCCKWTKETITIKQSICQALCNKYFVISVPACDFDDGCEWKIITSKGSSYLKLRKPGDTCCDINGPLKRKRIQNCTSCELFADADEPSNLSKGTIFIYH